MNSARNLVWQPAPKKVFLDTNEVHVWHYNIEHSDNLQTELYAILSDAEQQKANEYHHENAKKEYIAAHGILRKILGEYIQVAAKNIDITIGAHGKPLLTAPFNEIKFNLSHSNNHILVAVAKNREVGIDLENTLRKTNALKLAQRFFTERETQILSSLSDNQSRKAFFRAWCRKEAILKAMGTGISYGLDRFEVSLLPDESAKIINVLDDEQRGKWTINDLPKIEHFASAVVVEGKGWELSCWNWN